MERNSLYRSARPRPGQRGFRGFTLVELMIVIIIIGVLAAIVIPQFSGASRQARENTLRDDLRFLRTQVQVYRVQHRGSPPGYPNGNVNGSPTEADFVDQMVKFTSEHGDPSTTASDVYRFGPYLSRVPSNPINDRTTIFVVDNGQPMPDSTSLPMMNGSEEYGWIYKAQTQEWMANLAGDDGSGKPYSGY